MNENVLKTILEMFGGSISETDGYFDGQIIIHINTVLMGLSQMSVIKPNTRIDENTTWTEVIDPMTDLEGIKSYIYLKVKKIFDPPTNSSVQKAMDDQIAELEWRLYAFSDSAFKEESD